MGETLAKNMLFGKDKPVAQISLTREEVARFKEITYHEYGVMLTDDQAYEQAMALLALFDTLLKKQLAFGSQNDTITDTVI